MSDIVLSILFDLYWYFKLCIFILNYINMKSYNLILAVNKGHFYWYWIVLGIVIDMYLLGLVDVIWLIIVIKESDVLNTEKLRIPVRRLLQCPEVFKRRRELCDRCHYIWILIGTTSIHITFYRKIVIRLYKHPCCGWT